MVADVPYCIMRGTALAEGIGEKLTRLAPMPFCHMVVAKPPINVSTKMVVLIVWIQVQSQSILI